MQKGGTVAQSTQVAAIRPAQAAGGMPRAGCFKSADHALSEREYPNGMEHHVVTHAQIVAPEDFQSLLIGGGLNLLAGIVILILGWAVADRAARWTRNAFDRLHHFDETLKPLFASVVRYTILFATVIAVLERFGVQTTSIITLLGATGLAIGLALQGTLSNVAAGVMLLILRPFRIGDWVTVTSAVQSGSVREIGLFTTILISADQALVSIPNSAIFNNVIVNSSREPLLRLNFTVAIDTANDIDVALKIVLEALNADRRILKVPAPTTGVQALKEYSVDLLVRGWVHNADGEATLFDLQRAIRQRFSDAGIAVPARRQLTAARDETALSRRPAARRSG
jgi:small conductance mechanosensitive channel